MEGFGNFDTLAAAYQESRRGFDERVFSWIVEKVGDLSEKKVLDVGCGTGISSRQLQERGATVVGADISREMIAQAEAHSRGIKYVVAPTHKLNFSKATFDAVTAFSSFHWFSDRTSVNEIVRVLKPNGTLVIVNKNDFKGIRRDVVPLFRKHGATMGGKDGYSPESSLRDKNFRHIAAHRVWSKECYSPEEALRYLSSIALWNQVPSDRKGDLQKDIESFCSIRPLERHIETVTIVATRPAGRTLLT